MNSEREEFEAWSKYLGYDRDELARDPRGSESRKYLSWYVEMTWQAWQAARRTATPTLPLKWVSLLEEARDNCMASTVEKGITPSRLEYRQDLLSRLNDLLAEQKQTQAPTQIKETPMACDICGKRGTPLTDLNSIYQADEIKAVCPECEKVVNGQLSALQKWASTAVRQLLKLFMRERAAQSKQGE